MKKIRAIVVDDELPARRELVFMLNNYEDIEVVGEAENGEEALELITARRPDVVFLDIQMPGRTGFDVAEEVMTMHTPPFIIFVTAYDEYALDAFRVNALDYLLKPIDEERFFLAVERLRKTLKTQDKKINIERISSLLNYIKEPRDKRINKVPCEKRGSIVLIDYRDIVYCYAEQAKVYVKTFKEKYATNLTLQELETRFNFIRPHRSFLVNPDKIIEVFDWFHGTFKLKMNDDRKSEIPVSRNQVKKLRKFLGI